MIAILSAENISVKTGRKGQVAMSKWISIKDDLPELFTYCLVMDNKGFINYAIYTDDVEYGENSRGNYFAEVESVRFEDGEYMCEDIGAEILNVNYYLELPQGFSYV